ncbi:hypothetical protein ANCDUO_01051 [Ancylostoma duodenale]|uniref:Uncharacterized protein n=1 Tax=Ancylostoma duodenale TaxID=51022 RepID=A0A0C2DF50_9BILA|nr:hypothetical protein ANCDUO_01051 [Ancylostoma duodenale]
MSEVDAGKDDRGKVCRYEARIFPSREPIVPKKRRLIVPPTAGPLQPLSNEEMREVVEKMKVGEVLGTDGVRIEAWKSLGEQGLQ